MNESVIDLNEYIVKNEGGDFEVLPEGSYTFEVIDIKIEPNVVSTYNGKESIKDKLYFYSAVLDEAHRGEVIMMSMSPSFIKKMRNGNSSRLYLLTQAVTDEFIDDEEGYPVGALLNGQFIGSVSHSENNGRTYANIDAMKPVRTELERLEGEELESVKESISSIHAKVQENIQYA